MAATPAAGKTILIAEDEDFIANLYKVNLEKHGVRVLTVGDGNEAIAAIDSAQPDLVLLDLLMPDVDGFQVLDHIRKKQYAFPVVILTNLSQEIDKQKCEELGAKDFFVKSDLSVEELWERICGYL
ncbi:hypothetical protein COU80_02260 [Candidatus Peregrinibacteria bacterium CG10_big_fil_rev_8_21_14_0_10_55_24]|nr:MAG: hypothetical protein COU80_02260 [Candidatus Peregrinibacteria bacterium CG10_big_fil_rev_8_21_14_0_10_55_24]